MALDERVQMPATAEERHETTETQDLTILEKLRRFAQTRVQVLALMAGIATPLVAADCAQKPDVAAESTAKLQLSLQPVMASPLGFVGVEVYSSLNEPLQDTHIELIDDQGDIIYSQSHPIAQGEDSISFIEKGYQGSQDVALEGANQIRKVIISGHDIRGNLIQQEISVPVYVFDTFTE